MLTTNFMHFRLEYEIPRKPYSFRSHEERHVFGPLVDKNQWGSKQRFRTDAIGNTSCHIRGPHSKSYGFCGQYRNQRLESKYSDAEDVMDTSRNESQHEKGFCSLEESSEVHSAAEDLLRFCKINPATGDSISNIMSARLDIAARKEKSQNESEPNYRAKSINKKSKEDDAERGKEAASEELVAEPTMSINQLPEKRTFQELKELTVPNAPENIATSGPSWPAEKLLKTQHSDKANAIGIYKQGNRSPTSVGDVPKCTNVACFPADGELEILKFLLSHELEDVYKPGPTSDHNSETSTDEELETGIEDSETPKNLIEVDDTCVLLGYTRAGTRGLQFWREVRGPRRATSEQEVDALVEKLRCLLGISDRPVFLVQLKSAAEATHYWEFELKNGTRKQSYWKEASIEDLQRDIKTKRHVPKKSALEIDGSNLADVLTKAHGLLDQMKIENDKDDAFLADARFLERTLQVLNQLVDIECSPKLKSVKEKLSIDMVKRLLRSTSSF